MTVEGKGQFLPSFLWQAPNSNAALYFGDAWEDWLSAVGFDDGSSSEMPTIFENIRLAREDCL
jgi:hypothetical protein